MKGELNSKLHIEIEMQLFKIVFWIYSIRYIVTLQIYIYILN